MGPFPKSGKPGRQDPEGAPDRIPTPRPAPAESEPPARWLYALNSFLERAFREADRDTGC